MYTKLSEMYSISGTPDLPYNVSVNCTFTERTVLVRWMPNFDGGALQTFIVSYKSSDGIQRNTTATSQQHVTIAGLKHGTVYFFKVIASNKNGHTYSEERSCITKGIHTCIKY